ncbi:MAG TPA: orotidine-5'-phosphate decarboxylase [Acidimicrobiales bacterium]|jgi:orotidine-5'-phosphate decarboxylase
MTPTPTSTQPSFGDRVSAAAVALGPVCAGIDPWGELLERWDLPDNADGLHTFSDICVEAFAGTVPVIKPQVAFFERHGSAGIAALEHLIATARDQGLIVVADAKRGDIGTTSAAYAEAWLSASSPLAVDAMTVHPYLGYGALEPFIKVAAENHNGVIVVTRSSNPEGRSLQEAITANGSSVENSILSDIASSNASPGIPPGTVGAVIGATLPPSHFPLSQLGGVILALGIGAQGAGPADVADRFAGCKPGTVLASASRSLLSLGPDVSRLRQAAADLAGELSALMA